MPPTSPAFARSCRPPSSAWATPISRGGGMNGDRERPIRVCVGVASWKREAVARMIGAGDAGLIFARQTSRAVELATAQGGAIAVWPSREPAALEGLARMAGVPLARIEDGFLRG